MEDLHIALPCRIWFEFVKLWIIKKEIQNCFDQNNLWSYCLHTSTNFITKFNRYVSQMYPKKKCRSRQVKVYQNTKSAILRILLYLLCFLFLAPMTLLFAAFPLFCLSFPPPAASASGSRNCATSFVSQPGKKDQIRQSFSLPPSQIPPNHWLPLENQDNNVPLFFLLLFFSLFFFIFVTKIYWAESENCCEGEERGLEITSSNLCLIIGIRTFVTPSIESEFKVSELPTDLFAALFCFLFRISLI